MSAAEPISRSRLFGALAWTSGAKVLGQLTTLLTTVILTRLLSKNDFGLMAMAMVYMSVLDIFVDFGFLSAIIQARTVDRRQLSSCFWLLTVGSILIACFTYFERTAIADVLGEYRLAPVLTWMSAALLALPLQIVCKGELTRELQMRPIVLIELIASVLRSALSVVCAYFGLGVMSLAYGYLVEKYLLAAGLLFASTWRPTLVCRPGELSQIGAFGLQVILGNALWIIYYKADNVIIGKLLGAETLGVYTVATQLGNAAFQFISSSWHRLMFPLYARLQDSAELAGVFLGSSSGLALITVPVFVTVSALADDIVLLLYGSAWTAAVTPLQVMSLVAAMQVIATLLGQLLTAKGFAKQNTQINLVSTLAFVSAFLLGAWLWGLAGILAAWLILYPFRFYAYLRATAPLVKFSVHEYARQHLPTIYASVLLLIGLRWGRTLVPVDYLFLRISVATVIGGVCYACTQYVLNRDAVMRLIRLLRQRTA